MRYTALVALIAVLIGGCSFLTSSPPQGDSAPSKPRDVSNVPDAVPRVEPRSRGGNAKSYEVFGQRYHTLNSSQGFSQRGIASWYGTKFHGNKTANGETYDMYIMSAAHKELPIPTYLRVNNLGNGRSVIVRVNDRGPFHDNRIIDLSYAAAARLDMLREGTALVEITAIDPRHSQTTDRPKTGETGPPHANNIYLQAGAFGDKDNARRLARRLQDELQQVVRIQMASNTLYRVQVGPLPSVKRADHVSSRMEQLGIKTPLVVIE